MPRATPYPSNIHALISSISYPDLPGPSELDALRATLEQQSAAVAADLEKKLRREKKRKERDESNYPSEAAALEANGRAGMKLEALERARLESTAKRASPSTVKVKRERLSGEQCCRMRQSAAGADHILSITCALQCVICLVPTTCDAQSAYHVRRHSTEEEEESRAGQ